MNVGKAIYYLLSNAESVTNIAGTRIYPELAEQEAVAPYAVYQIVSVNPDDTNDGPAVIDEVVVDILCVAESYNEAADLATAVRASLDRVRGTYNGVNVESIQYDSTDSDVQDSPRRYEQTVTLTVRVFRDAAQIATGQNIDQLTLGRLYDVTDDATTGQVIIKQADGTWAGGDAAATLGDLTNVNIDGPQDREALVYDQDSDTWINGASTKLAIRVINQTGSTLLAGTPVKASGVQGDQVKVTVYQANQDPKLYIGMLDSDIPNGGTGYARQTGTIYHLNTAHLNVGDILYVNELSLILNNGLFYLSTTMPTGIFGNPVAKIPTAIVLRKHENTGRVYVRTWTPDSTLDELANVSVSNKSAGDVLVWNGSVWAAGATLAPSLYELRDVFDYSGATLQSGTILAWDAVNGYWFPQPKISYLPDNSVYYLGQYDTEAAANRVTASTASVIVERYLTIQGDGEGESISAQSDTPSAGNIIVRKIWYKANSFDTDKVDTWTLVHTFADDTAYSATEATFEALLNAQTYGTPPFTLAQSWEDVPAFTGLLDTYSGALVAYDLRRLSGSYAGSAINVRRASDNAVQDIGFDASGNLDTSALASFCSGTNGYVVRFYDQSGNGNDAVQATTSAQPQIVASGTVSLDPNTGLPAIKFNGSSTSLQNSAFGSLVAAPNFAFGVVNFQSTANQYYTDSIATGRSATGIVSGNYSIRGLNGGTASTGVVLMTSQQLSTGAKLYVNGTQALTNSGSTLVTWSNVILGTGQTGLYLNGYLSEFILYNSDQSSNRAGIETNINDYYTIY